jgi:IS4 transposase
MYRNTLFSEVMKGLPRETFEKIAKHQKADRYSKHFGSWDQLIALVYSQISGCKSLREIEEGFNSQSVHHYHLGCGEIKRSTLADANANRDSSVFEQACNLLLQQAHRKVKRELKDLLYLIDSTPIPLKGLGFENWTKDNHSHRTQGLKIHMMIEAKGNIPVHADITAPNINDVTAGRDIPLEAGATYVFDKGYCDYNWWYDINQANALFVTRFKKNAGLTVVHENIIPRADEELIQADTIVTFKNKHPGGRRFNHYHGTHLRRIVIERPDKTTPLVIATNDFNRSAQEVAELYKKRWGIELFFKWLKQNLKMKTFLGRSENAVKTQIYTALITYLLIEFHRARNGIEKTLKMCLVMIRSGLFQRPQTEALVARRQRKREREFQNLQGALAL